jgi:hypothetical protein
MAKSLKYDCYAFLAVNQPFNTYPIRNAERHLAEILSLKKGDVLYIKGLGHLQVHKLNVNNYDYVDRGKDGLYQEISVGVREIQY